MLLEVGWSESDHFLEYLGEVGVLFEAQFECYLLNAQVGEEEQPLGLQNAALVDDLGGGLAENRSDDLVQLAGGNAQFLRIEADRVPAPEIPLDECVEFFPEPVLADEGGVLVLKGAPLEHFEFCKERLQDELDGVASPLIESSVLFPDD